jgi:hypothetical protein
MNRLLHAVLWVLLLAANLPSALALDDGWPRTLPVGEGLVTIYPPQVDGLEGDLLRYRAALAWRPNAGAEPVFGAGWFESRVAIDQANRIVYTLDLKLTNTRFPEDTADFRSDLAAAIAQQAPGWNLDLSLDDLEAGLRATRAEEESLRNLNTTPPRIVYRDHPAVLLTLDGEPILRDIENTPYKAVVNTPYPLISDGRSYYLNAAKDVWYRADRATGPYRYEPSPPVEIAAMVKPDDDAGMIETAAEPVTAANAPEIVVATEPTELVVTDGAAVFVPLVDDLLVLQNSDDDVFMHVASQQFYIVLAGRWYHAGSLNGPWAYQSADRLPAVFADIPRDSAQADSRVYVAGTPEAEEAVLDAQVPQTKAVARGQADVDVEYDGEPEFAPVDGTDLEYAANTGATVLHSDRRYYLVEDGVWYESATPNGPWEVATSRPAGVAAIAPTSPVYNVKYVYVYGNTPDVVYVGYTPGYFGSYVYAGSVVFGTGWYYRPWVSPWYYYPRPSTWGLHVGYNSWSGWSFGLAWNWGWNWGWGWSPFYAGFYSGGYWHHNHYWHHPHRGYWRPRGYRPRPVHHAGHGYPRDRYGHGGYRADRRGYAGGPRVRDDGRSADRGRRPANSGARDPVFASRSKEPRHRTGPVQTSDLWLKAVARDANAAAARKLLVADSRGNVRPAAAPSRTGPATMLPGGDNRNAVRSRTEPVRAGVPRARNGESRRNRDDRATQRQTRSDVSRPGRRSDAAVSRPAADAPYRQAGQRPLDRNSAGAASAPSRRSSARQDQNRRGPGPVANPRREPTPGVSRGQPAQRQSPRATPGRPQPAAPPPSPRSRAAAPGSRSNRPAVSPSRPRAAHQNGGPRNHPAKNGAGQSRRDRHNLP